jgi:hypothetical protein
MTFTTALLALAALFAGTVDAIAGCGGLITVPALHLAGLPAHVALGTNKGQSVWGALAATIAFWRADRVDRRQALFAFPLALAGSFGGAELQLVLSNKVLDPIVIAMLIGAAVLLLVKKPTRDADAPEPHWWIAGTLSLVIGAYDGFFGPGTGTFLIVGFVALCGRSLVHASADAKVVNLASNIAAFIAFARAGTIVWDIALPMAVGQLCGGIIGTHFALRGGARIVRIMVLLVSASLIIKLGWDTLQPWFVP